MLPFSTDFTSRVVSARNLSLVLALIETAVFSLAALRHSTTVLALWLFSSVALSSLVFSSLALSPARGLSSDIVSLFFPESCGPSESRGPAAWVTVIFFSRISLEEESSIFRNDEGSKKCSLYLVAELALGA